MSVLLCDLSNGCNTPLTPEGIAVEAGVGYYLPLGEGKYIPANDAVWSEYLNGKEYSTLENFSMPFVAIDCGDKALVYVMENPYRAVVQFDGETDIRLKLVGQASTLNPSEQNNVRMYAVEAASKNGYLVGPYDSYHSIHQPGEEQWNTAAFSDTSLYENATVQNENGKKIPGFQNTGRKLNPTLAMPSVKQRVQEIVNTGVRFNSWFVDCDATGEVYDDYSPEHPTTKQQDVKARLERLDYITREQGMVVGSEGGNDFAVNNIAFAHGIELQSFSWMDADMKTNKDSEYYLGKYYSAHGGVPEKFAKPIPVKEIYRKLFLDMSYQIPLYKLVYNDCVITAAHWDWSTFKIKGESENRMIREILYNVPPLYHLDRNEWDNNQDRITAHHAVWSTFSKKAVTQEMTGFTWLTNDRLVQSTSYGTDLQVVANFSEAEYMHEGTVIPSRSVLLIDGEGGRIYTP